ncbi:MAG: hypothetical protein MRZ93_05935, partial [Lachnospiraceae bacterium]|nr:hypothetical protein [Lachnospiraceae bacterium]
MKRKMLVTLLCITVVLSSTTACGAKKDTTTAETETEDVAPTMTAMADDVDVMRNETRSRVITARNEHLAVLAAQAQAQAEAEAAAAAAAAAQAEAEQAATTNEIVNGKTDTGKTVNGKINKTGTSKGKTATV